MSKMKKLLGNTSGSAQMIGVVIAGLVAIIVGVMIWYKINNSLYYSWLGVGTGAHAAINSTWAGVNTTANSIWTMFPIVAIVVIAGVILSIVMGFGRQQM